MLCAISIFTEIFSLIYFFWTAVVITGVLHSDIGFVLSSFTTILVIVSFIWMPLHEYYSRAYKVLDTVQNQPQVTSVDLSRIRDVFLSMILTFIINLIFNTVYFTNSGYMFDSNKIFEKRPMSINDPLYYIYYVNMFILLTTSFWIVSEVPYAIELYTFKYTKLSLKSKKG